MLLKLSKKINPVFFLYFFVFVICLWFPAFFIPLKEKISPVANPMPLYALLLYSIDDYYVISMGIAVILLLLQTFLITRINVKHMFIEGRSYLPSFLFFLICSVPDRLPGLHPVFPGALFLLVALSRCFMIYKKERVFSYFFDSTFLISVASLFYFDMIYFIFFFWVAYIIIRKISQREWIISLIGMITPYILAGSWYFLTDQWTGFVKILIYNFSFEATFPHFNLYDYIFFGCSGLLLIITIIYLYIHLGQRKISTRKYFMVFIWLLLFSIILYFFMPSVSVEMLFIAAIPVTYIFSNYFLSVRSKYRDELLFTVFILSLIMVRMSHLFNF